MQNRPTLKTIARLAGVSHVAVSKALRDAPDISAATKERVKKYYPLDLRDMCRRAGAALEELVAEIIIGPESTQSLAILRDYLRDNGLAPLAENVSLSDCPLRGMPV